MYNVLLGVQYVSIALMLFMCAYITRKWSKPVHGWLFFCCCVTLINNAGYLGVMLSRTEGEAILTTQLSYLGRTWIPFALLNFVILLCKERRYPKITIPLAVFHACVYALVISIRKNTLYYRSFTFDKNGIFPHITHTNGIVYNVYMMLIFFYVIFALILLARTIKKHKNAHKRQQLFFVLMAIFADGLFLVLGYFRLIPGYDLTMIGYTLSAVFLYIALFRYDLLGAREIARSFMIDRLSEGIIALDSEEVIQYINKKAKELYPELEIGSNSLPPQITKAVESGTHEHISIGEKMYAVEQKNLTHKNEPIGRIYALIDETEHVRYMEEKEAQKIQQVQIEAMQRQIRMGNETIFAIANAVEARDKNTGKHSYRVAEYSVQIAAELGFTPEEQDQIRRTGLLHDIGKIGVPDSILNKPAKLTDEEYAIMKTHTVIGGDILKDFTLIPHVDDGAKFHHERYDGKGYPTGLKGEDIPLNARIIGIADAFDAMTANRVYRKALDIGFVKEELKRCAGTQFDPKLTEIMLSLIESGKINPTDTVRKVDG